MTAAAKRASIRFSTGSRRNRLDRHMGLQALGMPALLLALVLVLAGCVPGGSRSDGFPTADAPFTLTALDVGHPIFRSRCLETASQARSHHGAVLPFAAGALSPTG